ncbi:MAG: cryptochrome/photolyase family protein, partial [Candidatus Puniceispirillales bacterium]
MKTLRVILGDQLSEGIASLRDMGETDIILMAEVMDEASYVRHHKKKLTFIFSAMRHFADRLREQGREVIYV